MYLLPPKFLFNIDRLIVRSPPPCREKSVEASAFHWPSSFVPYCRWRLTYVPTLLLHRRPTPAGTLVIIDASPASLGGQNPGEHKTLGQPALRKKNTKTLGQPSPRTKTSGQPSPREKTSGQPAPRTFKRKKRPTFKCAVRTKTKTMPNLQGCSQN